MRFFLSKFLTTPNLFSKSRSPCEGEIYEAQLEKVRLSVRFRISSLFVVAKSSHFLLQQKVAHLKDQIRLQKAKSAKVSLILLISLSI